MKYKCEKCGEVLDGLEHGPYGNSIIRLGRDPLHRLCKGVLIQTPEVLNSESQSDPEETQRLHESADRMAKRIAEQREAGIDLNGDAQAMATASIKREVERCRALLGEIEAEYLPGPSDTVGRLRMLKNILKQGKETEG